MYDWQVGGANDVTAHQLVELSVPYLITATSAAATRAFPTRTEASDVLKKKKGEPVKRYNEKCPCYSAETDVLKQHLCLF